MNDQPDHQPPDLVYIAALIAALKPYRRSEIALWAIANLEWIITYDSEGRTTQSSVAASWIRDADRILKRLQARRRAR